jgi:hypothetical protein
LEGSVRYSFNPPAGLVKSSDLLGTCLYCQAETVIEWHNRDRWEAGKIIEGEHTATCPYRDEQWFYRKA